MLSLNPAFPVLAALLLAAQLTHAATSTSPPGARLAGVDTRTVRCLNIDTGQEVDGVLPEVQLDEMFDCAQFGLETRDLDFIVIEVTAVAFGDPAFNGEVSGFSEANLNCRNRTTGQVVTIAAVEDRPFDCLNAGLTLSPQDGVALQIFGLAGAPRPPLVTFVQTGMRARRAVCQNNTDPQVVVIDLPGSRLSDAVDCGARGLQISSGDELTFQIAGASAGEVLMSTSGLESPLTVRCDNGATGESVTLASGREFSCEEAGLDITFGDPVTVTVRGRVTD